MLLNQITLKIMMKENDDDSIFSFLNQFLASCKGRLIDGNFFPANQKFLCGL
jgi:hypothetical protein